MRSAPTSLRLFSAATVCIFTIVALLPECVVFAQSLWRDGSLSLAAYTSVLAEPRRWSLLRNTLVLAGGTTLLSAMLGIPVAFALERRRVLLRGGLTHLLALPLLVPPYINAVVWADILGRNGLLRFGLNPPVGGGPAPFSVYTLGGAVLVLALSSFPIVAFATLLALRRYDARLEDPARLVCRAPGILRHIAWPLVAPAALSGCVLVFVLSLVEFAVPSFLQVNVYTVEIYERFSLTYDPAEAAAMTLPLLACGLLALGLWWTYVRPRAGRLSGTGRRAPLHTGRIDWLATALCAGLIAFASILPLAILIRRSLPLTSYLEAWQTAREEIGTSLLVGAGSATLLTALAFAMALASRFERPAARLYTLSPLPFLVSGPLLGVGLILVWNRPGPASWVYDSLLILMLACAARFLFFAHQAVGAALRDVPRRRDEAAAVAGVPWYRSVRGVLLPPVAPALAALWGLTFLFTLRELDAAVLVAPPGRSTLAVRLFGLMHYGPSRLVAALSVITILIVVAGALATAFAYRRLRRFAHAGD
ncbi:MAG: iron ABC transporter permease [FCB group bacterium]|jgi:iron(III) transport system permease protein|nr:iron ABC transporter permease [FCB group bacterium]